MRADTRRQTWFAFLGDVDDQRDFSAAALVCADRAADPCRPLLTAKPEEVGLSSERLSRVHEAVQRHIDAKAISGAVTLVARNGRFAHLEAHGLIDIESKRP